MKNLILFRQTLNSGEEATNAEEPNGVTYQNTVPFARRNPPRGETPAAEKVKEVPVHLEIEGGLSDTIAAVFSSYLVQDIDVSKTWLELAAQVADDQNVRAYSSDMSDVERTRLVLDAMGIDPDNYEQPLG